MSSYPYQLTEGECQKVMIAIALANQPRLLIADEPTNTMEATTKAQIFGRDSYLLILVYGHIRSNDLVMHRF